MHESGERQPPLLHWLNDMRRVKRRRRAVVEGGWAQCFPALGNDVLHSAFPLRASWLSEHIPTEPSIKLSMQWPTTPSSQRTYTYNTHTRSLVFIHSLYSFGSFFISSLVPCHLAPFRITWPAISLLLNHFQANFSPPKHTHTHLILSINQYHQDSEVQVCEFSENLGFNILFKPQNNQKGIRVWEV